MCVCVCVCLSLSIGLSVAFPLFPSTPLTPSLSPPLPVSLVSHISLSLVLSFSLSLCDYLAFSLYFSLSRSHLLPSHSLPIHFSDSLSLSPFSLYVLVSLPVSLPESLHVSLSLSESLTPRSLSHSLFICLPLSPSLVSLPSFALPLSCSLSLIFWSPSLSHPRFLSRSLASVSLSIFLYPLPPFLPPSPFIYVSLSPPSLHPTLTSFLPPLYISVVFLNHVRLSVWSHCRTLYTFVSVRVPACADVRSWPRDCMYRMTYGVCPCMG